MVNGKVCANCGQKVVGTQCLRPKCQAYFQQKQEQRIQTNYQELARRIEEEINPLLISLTSQFSGLSSVSELNTLTETLLSKFFQGYIYREAIHDELGKQLAIANHKKYEPQKTGNNSTFTDLLLE
jgi:hypothetical protein